MDSERAVSPVIGVILMVAITVMLSAVIATAVFNFEMGQQQPHATIEIDDHTNYTEITVTNLQNADGVAVVYDNGDVNRYTTSIGGKISLSVQQNGTIQAYRGEIQENESIDNAEDSQVIHSF